MTELSPQPTLLCDDEGAPVEVINAAGAGPFVFVCEHASRRIPRALGTLGLEPAALQSHIAWDPGALGLARSLSSAFDSTLVAANFSRLAFDCNRPPIGESGIVSRSEHWEIPGNKDLDALQSAARIREIYEPFRQRLSETIRTRMTENRRLPIVVTVHSFTPVYLGNVREVQIGILHDTDARFADLLLEGAETLTDLVVRRNDPYGPRDGVTHTLQQHALPRGLPNAMIEVRNDLLADEFGRRKIGELIVNMLQRALAAWDLQAVGLAS